MHDSETGHNSAQGAETLVLTNNSIYNEPSSTYYNVISNIDHNHHNHYHDHFHIDNHHIITTNHHHQNHLADSNCRGSIFVEDDQDHDDIEEEDDDEVDEDEKADDEDEEDDEDEDEDDEDEDDDSDDDSRDIVDPGQNCQPAHGQQQPNILPFIHGAMQDESDAEANDILDGDRMLEVTRKLFRNTERDPDRDLRKQVLLKIAIKKLPHFMEYSRYTDTLDRGFHNNMSPQAYYEHHDSQQKFYHSVQPNAIQMSTTSLRMLDLNDDQDPDLNSIEQTTDDCANSLVSHSNESAEVINETSLLESSLNSSSEFYNNSHDSGIVLCSARSNKRSSSSLGLDHEMDIDHLTELSSCSSNSFITNNQYKKLRKRDIIE